MRETSSERSRSDRDDQEGDPGKEKVSRLFKKMSPDGLLTLFLPRREIHVICDHNKTTVEPLEGVVLISRKLIENPKIQVFVQVILELRYGREDEELMGLHFCSEMVVASQQIYPDIQQDLDNGSCFPSEDLLSRYNCVLKPFKLDLGRTLPPTIKLQPNRIYSGSQIGTNFMIQLYPVLDPDNPDLPLKKQMIKMSFRVTEVYKHLVNCRPSMAISKHNFFTRRNIKFQVTLNQSIYGTGDNIDVTVSLHIHPPNFIKKIKIIVMQGVEVAMFSSGYFKNETGQAEDCPMATLDRYCKVLTLTPKYQPGKHWVAVKEQVKEGQTPILATTVNSKEKSLFVIRVLYYVQVKVTTGGIEKDLCIKMPFQLIPEENV